MNLFQSIGISSLLVVAAVSAAPTTISDADFTNVAADWSIAAVSSDQGNGTAIPVTSTTLARQAGELNAEMVIGDHADAAGGRYLAAVIIYEAITYTPSSEGAIGGVGYAAKASSDDSANPFMRPVLRQGGKYYALAGNEFRNSTLDLANSRAGDWHLYRDVTTDGTTFAVNESEHPDFTVTGGEIAFGVIMQGASSSSDAANFTMDNDIDGFSVTIEGPGMNLDPFAAIDHPEAVRPAKPTPAPGLPNILVVLCDDLGYGDTALTGHPHIETPNIDNLRTQGAFCTNYYSAANICSPSRAATMTGRMPYRLGIYSFIRDAEDFVHMTHDEVTLPQVLGKVGYECANIGKWHVSHLDAIAPEELPTMRHYGWDYWLSSDNNLQIHNKNGWWRNETAIGTINGYAAEVVSDEAIDWLNNTRDSARPFLLFATYYEPHHDSEAPASYKTKYQNLGHATGPARYYGCVDHMDHQIGRVLGELDTLGLTNDTLVIFTSDHGPNPSNNSQYGTAAPYRGTKYQVWDGSTHVPAIIRWPGEVAAGATINEPIGNIDLLQTLAAITGAEEHLPDDRPLDGSDFSPLLTGAGTFTRGTPLQWHYYKSSASLLAAGSPQAALRSGDLVIAGWYDSPVSFPNVRWMPHPGQNGGINDMDYLTGTGAHTDKTLSLTQGTFRLYDLSTDIHQDTDIYDPGNPVHTGLRDQLIQHHQELQKGAPGWGFGPWDKPQSSFNDWRSNHWSAPDDTNDTISGPDANPDGDPWSNFLEYSLSLDPTVLEPTGGARGPRYSLETYDVGGGPRIFQTYTFTVPDSADVGYQLGYSNDLESWSFDPGGSILTKRVRNADETSTVTYRDKEPADGHPRRFVRLRVEKPSS